VATASAGFKPTVGGGSFLAHLLKDQAGSSGVRLSDVQLAAQANTFTLAVGGCGWAGT